jgi:hypothetical protein
VRQLCPSNNVLCNDANNLPFELSNADAAGVTLDT